MKKDIRAEVLKKRDSIPPERKTGKDSAIKDALLNLDEFINAKNVLIYASFRSEVSTGELIERILCLGKKLLVPLVDSKQKTLTLYEIKDTDELIPGYMGIPEPNVDKDRKVEIKDIDIIVIPGTGFDQNGNRLGYGGGYYDRLLAETDKDIPKVALAFEEQIVDEIPSEPHDMTMDIIVTDERVIRTKVQ